MAEPLKNSFGPDVPSLIAEMFSQIAPNFDHTAFVADCLDGYEDLELMARGRQIAAVLAAHLPTDRAEALKLVTSALAVQVDNQDMGNMKAFLYMPHSYFIADCGLDHFELAMTAQYEMTKLFSAEFSIRPYLEQHRDLTLSRLRDWTADPSEHVRRLVSEGTRPRLPWAGRLREFQANPTPVLDLLELLRHDRSEYVRRSVANNLNDIAKDHPQVVVDVATRWWTDSNADEQRMIRHGLRSLIKAGHPGALAVLGFGSDSPARVVEVTTTPPQVQIGEKVRVEVVVDNPSADTAGALVDIVVNFVKANGSTSPKVFKGAETQLAPGESKTIGKTISLKQHTTRTHYQGRHIVEVQINGQLVPGCTFELIQ
ncbi:MAG: DNA alkylation repair protein [Actinobacteria bacterium]|nr:DNA alkylation repair protein [Actinomycetota bacterium]